MKFNLISGFLVLNVAVIIHGQYRSHLISAFCAVRESKIPTPRVWGPSHPDVKIRATYGQNGVSWSVSTGAIVLQKSQVLEGYSYPFPYRLELTYLSHTRFPRSMSRFGEDCSKEEDSAVKLLFGFGNPKSLSPLKRLFHHPCYFCFLKLSVFL